MAGKVAADKPIHPLRASPLQDAFLCSHPHFRFTGLHQVEVRLADKEQNALWGGAPGQNGRSKFAARPDNVLQAHHARMDARKAHETSQEAGGERF
jgi:hypothetical protein